MVESQGIDLIKNLSGADNALRQQAEATIRAMRDDPAQYNELF